MLIAGAFFVCLFSAVDSQAQGPIGTCEEAAELAVLPSPVAPWKGAPLRVIFAAEKPIEGELSLIAPDGSVAAKSRERQVGPPYFCFAEVASRHVAQDGLLVAMKGVLAQDEIAALPPHVAVIATPELDVPGLDAKRHLVVMRVIDAARP